MIDEHDRPDDEPESPQPPEGGASLADLINEAFPNGLPPFPMPGIHERHVQGSVIEQTVALVERYIRPEVGQIIAPDGTPLPVIIKNDGTYEVFPDHLFDQYRVAPDYRNGTARLTSLDSFITLTRRFADNDTVIFANDSRSAPSLATVFDYHRAGADGEPRFGRHRAAFAFPLSDEWEAWQAGNGQAMEMAAFARFLEDRIIDVMPVDMISLKPDAQAFVQTLGGTVADPSKLMQLATGLQIFETSNVREATKLASGEATIEFQSEHLDQHGQKINIPQTFVIGIPVFKNGPVYQILARLRYRKTGPKIVFWYDLWRTDRVFDDTFTEAVDRVGAETGLPVLLGRPEA